MDGILIAIEGIDGAGKTTQARLLAGTLRSAGEDVVVSKEPTDGPWGQRIRESAKNGRMSLEDEIEAFRNDRIGHVRDLVRPALDDGKVVILDRYFYSFLAYQGSRGADLDALREMTRSAPVPHAAFLLDIDPRRSLERIAASRSTGANAFETVSALDRAREVFLAIFRDTPTGLVIDASSAVGEIERQIAVRLLQGVLRDRPSATTEALLRFRRSSPTPTSM